MEPAEDVVSLVPLRRPFSVFRGVEDSTVYLLEALERCSDVELVFALRVYEDEFQERKGARRPYYFNVWLFNRLVECYKDWEHLSRKAKKAKLERSEALDKMRRMATPEFYVENKKDFERANDELNFYEVRNGELLNLAILIRRLLLSDEDWVNCVALPSPDKWLPGFGKYWDELGELRILGSWCFAALDSMTEENARRVEYARMKAEEEDLVIVEFRPLLSMSKIVRRNQGDRAGRFESGVGLLDARFKDRWGNTARLEWLSTMNSTMPLEGEILRRIKRTLREQYEGWEE
jgi:hypothetical protein